MEDRIGHAKHQAKAAREKALMCREAVARNDWLTVAKRWDLLAEDLSSFQKTIANDPP